MIVGIGDANSSSIFGPLQELPEMVESCGLDSVIL